MNWKGLGSIGSRENELFREAQVTSTAKSELMHSRRDRVLDGLVAVFATEFVQFSRLIRDKEYRKSRKGVVASAASMAAGVGIFLGSTVVTAPLNNFLFDSNLMATPLAYGLFLSGIATQVWIQIESKLPRIPLNKRTSL